MLSSLHEILNHHITRRNRALQRQRRGVSAFLVAGATLVIFGAAALGVDYALLTNDRNQSQRACDAAALAGAQELKKTGTDSTDTSNASRIAISVAAQNGVTVTSSDISFLDSNTKIKVVASRTRNLYFARVLGISTGTVGTNAVAGVTVTTGTTRLAVPIGVTQATVDANTKPALNTNAVTLNLPRVVSDPYGLNDFMVFDLRGNSKSPTAMTNQLINGYPTQVGDENTSLNANDVSDNFATALGDRFSRSAASPYNDTWTGNVATSTGIRYNEILSGSSSASNPRVVYFVVNPGATSGGGTTKHEVLSLVPVYLESWSNSQLTIRFLPESVMKNTTTGGSTSVSLLS